MGELTDKVILVTGATRGIGLGISQVLAREGARVVVSSIEREQSREVVASLPGKDAVHLPLYLDVTHSEDRQSAFGAILERYGRLDGLVNNAGIYFGKPFMDTSAEDWRQVMAMDLDAVYDLCQRAIGLFLEQGGGAIVNITSVHTLATVAGAAPYAAAKAAIMMLSRGLAVEFSAKNIRVNCVAPGLVKTEIWKRIVAEFGQGEQAYLDYWKKNIPIQRIIQPEEIAEVVSFALSDRASALSGATLYVDGGMTSQLIATA
jgi:glucose 1-dehydrogenase